MNGLFSRTESTSSHKPSRWFDIFALLLLFAALQTAASQLVATEWVNNLYLVWNLVFIATFLGTALGYSSFSPIISAIITALYGMIIVPWQLGLTLGGGIPWRERLAALLEILNQTFDQLSNSENVASPILFLTIVTVITWLLSIYAFYTLTRYGQAWKSVIPAGVVMIVISTYGVKEEKNSFLLGLFVFIVLMLIARLTFIRRKSRWRSNRAILPADISYQMGKVIVIGSIMLVLLAWGTPVLGANLSSFEDYWQRVTQPFDKVRLSMRKLFAPIDSSIGLVSAEFIFDYFGDVLPLGRGNILSDDVIFVVEAPELPSAVERYYWRARHFDQYQDGQWKSTPMISSLVFPESSNLDIPNNEHRWETSVNFIPKVRLSTLYTPLQPNWVSRPVEAQFNFQPDGTVDVFAIRAIPSLMIDDEYTVKASLARTTITELRAAGTDYPTWIEEHYLQVPETITSRTLDLAKDITTGLDNPYDIVAAVTQYLRTNIEYIENLPEIPRNQDPIDWMLFDQRQGFCNYYASAEVIMLRSLGIPARLVVGFAQGDFSPDVKKMSNTGTGLDSEDIKIYEVRQRDAHAWPEVYFPGIGWVEFEPTANQRPLMRSPGVAAQDVGITSQQSEEELLELDRKHPMFDGELDQLWDQYEDTTSLSGHSSFPWKPFILWMILIVVLTLWRVMPLLEIPAFPLMLETSFQRLGIKLPAILASWVNREALPHVASAYSELNRALTRLNDRPHPAATPTERATALVDLIPEAKDPVETLVEEYHIFCYSPRSGDLLNALRASRIIRRLSYKALVQRLIAPFYKTNP